MTAYARSTKLTLGVSGGLEGRQMYSSEVNRIITDLERYLDDIEKLDALIAAAHLQAAIDALREHEKEVSK